MASNSKRAHKTEAAIAALLTRATLDEAAAEVGIATRTLKRWLKEPDFRQQYLEARRQIYSHAIGLAQRTLSEGVTMLRDILNDTEAPASARVAAFSRLEDMSRRGVEIEDFEARLNELEARVIGDNQ